jgi:uncharacterized protein YpiB (UPF0302 family)
MSNHLIFEQLKKLSFSDNALSLFTLLENYMDRIEFVKDHVGLKDVLFVAEDNASGYRYPIFLCLDVNIKFGDKDHNLVEMEKSIMHKDQQIKNSLIEFFVESQRMLYIRIGFKESVLKPEDAFIVYEAMEKKEIEDPHEMLMKLRRFPSWYEARYPEEIQREQRILLALEEAQKTANSLYKKELMKQIDEALLNNDAEKFYELSKRLNSQK